MPLYRVQLSTDTAVAETTLEANSLRAALDAAFALDCDGPEFVDICEVLPINEIIVAAADGSAQIWRDEKLRLRLAAEDLYIASIEGRVA